MPDLEEDGRDDVFDDAVVEDAPLLTVDAVVNAARLKANATAKEYNTCTREIPLRGTRRKLVDDMYGIIASTLSSNPKIIPRRHTARREDAPPSTTTAHMFDAADEMRDLLENRPLLFAFQCRDGSPHHH